MGGKLPAFLIARFLKILSRCLFLLWYFFVAKKKNKRKKTNMKKSKYSTKTTSYVPKIAKWNKIIKYGFAENRLNCWAEINSVKILKYIFYWFYPHLIDANWNYLLDEIHTWIGKFWLQKFVPLIPFFKISTGLLFL